MEIITKYFPDLEEQQIKQLAALKELYTGWNEKINVISRKDIDNFYERHVLHSLSIAKIFSFPDGNNVLDLGTGGGFPGIPLAIYFPKVHFHLVDSINKKLTVVKEVAASIGLNNITTQHTRAEAITGKKFDTVVTRAVAPLKDLWKWSEHLARGNRQWAIGNGQGAMGNEQRATSNGQTIGNGLICLKGGDLTQEISDSGLSPQIFEIEKIFNEAYFKDKYLLYVPRPS